MEYQKLDILAEKISRAVNKLTRLQQENSELHSLLESERQNGQELEKRVQQLVAEQEGREQELARLQLEEENKTTGELEALRSAVAEKDERLQAVSLRLEQLVEMIDNLVAEPADAAEESASSEEEVDQAVEEESAEPAPQVFDLEMDDEGAVQEEEAVDSSSNDDGENVEGDLFSFGATEAEPQTMEFNIDGFDEQSDEDRS